MDVFSKHEALDRLDCACSLLEIMLLNHEFIDAHGELKEKVELAISFLSDAYQTCGRMDQ